jgi:uncharacterized membrane protein
VKRTLLFIVGGILLGGIIHIAIVLLVPFYAERDAWAKIGGFGRDGTFHTLPIPEAGAEPIAFLDPRMVQAVCRFTLEDGPVRILAELPEEFWSLAVFDRRGRNVYSLNDRASEGARLDVAILTPVQVAQLRQDPPASLETAIVLELPIDSGFALIRAFVPDSSLLSGTVSALNGADCGASL